MQTPGLSVNPSVRFSGWFGPKKYTSRTAWSVDISLQDQKHAKQLINEALAEAKSKNLPALVIKYSNYGTLGSEWFHEVAVGQVEIDRMLEDIQRCPNDYQYLEKHQYGPGNDMTYHYDKH